MIDPTATCLADLREALHRPQVPHVEIARLLVKLREAAPHWTQEHIARKVGGSQPSISNRLRLLSLSESILEEIDAGAISATAARDILLPHIRHKGFARVEAELLLRVADDDWPIAPAALREIAKRECSCSGRKFRPGRKIKTFDHLVRLMEARQYIYWNHKPLHHSWLLNMSYLSLRNAIRAGILRVAVRVED